MNPTLTQLKEILSYGEAKLVSKDELEKLFRQLVKGIQAWQNKQEDDINGLVKAVRAVENGLRQETTTMSKQGVEEAKRLIAQVEAKIPVLPDLSYVDNRLNGLELLSLEDVADNVPLLGEQVRDSLELLPKGEKLNIDAIENLREELDKVRHIQTTRKDNIVYVGGGGGSGGRIVKSYDISGSLNGVLKTFSLPAFYRIISVHSSSFPNAFRETTDWTSDGSAMTITFTSAIEASTTLAAGQTITIIYSEI